MVLMTRLFQSPPTPLEQYRPDVPPRAGGRDRSGLGERGSPATLPERREAFAAALARRTRSASPAAQRGARREGAASRNRPRRGRRSRLLASTSSLAPKPQARARRTPGYDRRTAPRAAYHLTRPPTWIGGGHQHVARGEGVRSRSLPACKRARGWARRSATVPTASDTTASRADEATVALGEGHGTAGASKTNNAANAATRPAPIATGTATATITASLATQIRQGSRSPSPARPREARFPHQRRASPARDRAAHRGGDLGRTALDLRHLRRDGARRARDAGQRGRRFAP
jgi:hypothetical protein